MFLETTPSSKWRGHEQSDYRLHRKEVTNAQKLNKKKKSRRGKWKGFDKRNKTRQIVSNGSFVDNVYDGLQSAIRNRSLLGLRRILIESSNRSSSATPVIELRSRIWALFAARFVSLVLFVLHVNSEAFFFFSLRRDQPRCTRRFRRRADGTEPPLHLLLVCYYFLLTYLWTNRSGLGSNYTTANTRREDAAGRAVWAGGRGMEQRGDRKTKDGVPAYSEYDYRRRRPRRFISIRFENTERRTLAFSEQARRTRLRHCAVFCVNSISSNVYGRSLRYHNQPLYRF